MKIIKTRKPRFDMPVEDINKIGLFLFENRKLLMMHELTKEKISFLRFKEIAARRKLKGFWDSEQPED